MERNKGSEYKRKELNKVKTEFGKCMQTRKGGMTGGKRSNKRR